MNISIIKKLFLLFLFLISFREIFSYKKDEFDFNINKGIEFYNNYTSTNYENHHSQTEDLKFLGNFHGKIKNCDKRDSICSLNNQVNLLNIVNIAFKLTLETIDDPEEQKTFEKLQKSTTKGFTKIIKKNIKKTKGQAKLQQNTTDFKHFQIPEQNPIVFFYEYIYQEVIESQITCLSTNDIKKFDPKIIKEKNLNKENPSTIFSINNDNKIEEFFNWNSLHFSIVKLPYSFVQIKRKFYVIKQNNDNKSAEYDQDSQKKRKFSKILKIKKILEDKGIIVKNEDYIIFDDNAIVIFNPLSITQVINIKNKYNENETSYSYVKLGFEYFKNYINKIKNNLNEGNYVKLQSCFQKAFLIMQNYRFAEHMIDFNIILSELYKDISEINSCNKRLDEKKLVNKSLRSYRNQIESEKRKKNRKKN